MSSKVESLCEELQTHILQHGLVGQDSKITFGFGARELDRAATPPRVVGAGVVGIFSGAGVRA